MQIQITGLKQAQDKLDRLGQKILAKASGDAIKRTALEVHRALQSEMKTAFDRPTPWAINSVRVDLTGANAKRQTAVVGLSAAPTDSSDNWHTPDFASHNVHGGGRPFKKEERILRNAGILPQGKYIRPAKSAWLDQHGNVSSQEIKQVLQSVGAMGVRARLLTPGGKLRSKAQNRYFVVRRAGMPIGIAERIWGGGGNMRMLFIFIEAPHYKARFKFHEIAHKIIESNWKRNFLNYLKEYRNVK